MPLYIGPAHLAMCDREHLAMCDRERAISAAEL
jgi:hypothetical protein